MALALRANDRSVNNTHITAQMVFLYNVCVCVCVVCVCVKVASTDLSWPMIGVLTDDDNANILEVTPVYARGSNT